jgi:hypothetical protein
MRSRLPLFLFPLLIAGCMSSEPRSDALEPSAEEPAALPQLANTPGGTTTAAFPATPGVDTQGAQLAPGQPLPVGGVAPEPTGQEAFNCRTVGNATMCDVAGDPNADNTRHTN